MSAPSASKRPGLSWHDLGAEPFRLFFPAAWLAGVLGVCVWPLHYLGVLPLFPGAAHARLMAHGFFAGFILGFLGTALPRMLSAPPLRLAEAAALLSIHLSMTIVLVLGQVRTGDMLLLLLLGGFAGLSLLRVRRRRDLPPPGFVLVALAFACLAAGTGLSLFLPADESMVFWVRLQHLLSYQGFVLLPIMGVGAFMFPRFFGVPNRHDFPESLTPLPGWGAKATAAFVAGAAILVSFVLEAAGWERSGMLVRVTALLVYLWREVPLHRGTQTPNAVSTLLKLSLGLISVGFVAVLLVPRYRVALLHLTLVGGFALTTLAVATRVVFGHSGNLQLLAGRSRWLKAAAGLMLLAMVTRISGDFWPKILVSHYSYGAILWSLGASVWAWHVLPKVLSPDRETG